MAKKMYSFRLEEFISFDLDYLSQQSCQSRSLIIQVAVDQLYKQIVDKSPFHEVDLVQLRDMILDLDSGVSD